MCRLVKKRDLTLLPSLFFYRLSVILFFFRYESDIHYVCAFE